MQRSILAVSPDLQFLEQIRSHLEEGGRFQVHGVTTAQGALEIAKISFFDVAILDAEITDEPFVPFTRDLVAIQPELKLLVFPIQNNPHHPVLAGLVTNGFLNKPFFTPEVGTALASLFHEPQQEPKGVVEPIEDLGALWFERPEIGMQRIEQLLGSTSANAGLLVMKGQVIAGSGPVNDSTVTNVQALLARYWENNDKSELVRFLREQGSTEEYLIYAAPLIHSVVLVLIYPPAASIQKVRGEVTQLRQEFQHTYPTTSDLRKDISESNPEHSISSPGTGSPVQPVEPFIYKNLDFDLPDLKPLEDEIEPEEIDNVLSVAELKNLDTMLANMPPPDPEYIDQDASNLPLTPSELIPPSWINSDDGSIELTSPAVEGTDKESISNEIKAIEEDEGLNPLHREETSATTNVPDFDFKLPWEDTNTIVPPPLPTILPQEDFNPVLEASIPSSWIDGTTDDTEITSPSIDAVEVNDIPNEFEDLEKDERLNTLPREETSGTTNVPGFDFELPWEDTNTIVPPPLPTILLQEDYNPVVEASIPPSRIDGATDDTEITSHSFDEVEENDIPIEFEDLEKDEDLNTLPREETSGTTNVPGFDFELPWEDTNNSVPSLLPPILPQEDRNPVPEGNIAPQVVEPLQNQDLNTSSIILNHEPGTAPLGIKGFRFIYTCILIPRNPNQYLARDLSERLGFILPQLHLGHGWRLTGISIRPLYLLWTVSVSLDVCPIQIVREIRRRTSTHIFSNFPDLRDDNPSNDFWSPGFLVISGSEPPTVSLIYDFISQTRKNQAL
jgi:REP element-mobilizing transposase RayT/ActR/RegA family two-component response regulator